MPRINKKNKRSTKKRNIRRKRRTNKRIKGGSDFGPASYNPTEMNPYTTYDLNKYSNDMSNLPNIQSARNVNIVGGKSKTKRRLRKMKGGDTSVGPQFTNPITSFGDTLGSYVSNDILKGNLVTSSAPYDQPINSKFGSHNPPLV
jgi:hypothetical protein